LVAIAELSKDLTLTLFLNDHGPLLSVLRTRCLVLDLDLKNLEGLQAEEGLYCRFLGVIYYLLIANHDYLKVPAEAH
jgi:hypothetical protein